MSKAPLKVVELFAGVGGFRIAMEGYPKRKNSKYDVVWSNQYEPKTKKQHANLVYKKRWPDSNHSESDIEQLVVDPDIYRQGDNISSIPDHDVLVGGFPCQDFSIANRSHNRGLDGTKGKLWWSIYALLKQKGDKAPSFVFLENVDRLLRSPTHQKGRDFAVILSCFEHLGYAVEWRVINAAEYGFPQKRKRVYILAYKKGTALYNKLYKANPKECLVSSGLFAKAFPIKTEKQLEVGFLPPSIEETLTSFSNAEEPFSNAGFMISGIYHHIKVKADYNGSYTTLGDILLPESDIPESYYIDEKDLPKWHQVKAAKAKERISRRTGKSYLFREGKVAFPDPLDKPARTILTKELSSYICREKLIVFQNDRYRGLHPIELERLNGFPDDFTKHEGVTDIKRGFFMGNALVIGVIRKIAMEIYRRT